MYTSYFKFCELTPTVHYDESNFCRSYVSIVDTGIERKEQTKRLISFYQTIVKECQGETQQVVRRPKIQWSRTDAVIKAINCKEQTSVLRYI